MQKKLIKWNKEHFGHYQSILKVLERDQSILKALERDQSILKALEKELEEILQSELTLENQMIETTIRRNIYEQLTQQKQFWHKKRREL